MFWLFRRNNMLLINKIACKTFERNLSLKTNLVLKDPYSANLNSKPRRNGKKNSNWKKMEMKHIFTEICHSVKRHLALDLVTWTSMWSSKLTLKIIQMSLSNLTQWKDSLNSKLWLDILLKANQNLLNAASKKWRTYMTASEYFFKKKSFSVIWNKYKK